MMDSTALSFKTGETIIVRDTISCFLFVAFCCLVAYPPSHSCITQFVKSEMVVSDCNSQYMYSKQVTKRAAGCEVSGAPNLARAASNIASCADALWVSRNPLRDEPKERVRRRLHLSLKTSV